ncbi:MAG TPA: DNA-processing protein DprA [Acidimicrobiales bacterium]|jgi:DNA processing protein|nr:DNA-processing protein DprA [Acidimicrobiales bacterium]
MTRRLPEEAYAAALASTPGVGRAALRRYLTEDLPSEAWRRSGLGTEADVTRIWRLHEEHEVSVLLRGTAEYPARLRDDPDAPSMVFCLGDPTVIDRCPTVGLVGTRSPTRYGIGVAAQFGADLAAAGVSVVSGLALGIDGAAHEGATAAGAPPIAVVAGGLHDPYPRRHARLWARVAEHGAVLSESPAGIATEKWRFPVRNQILAALCDVVVVVESRHAGGSMHTVTAAMKRGIPVGAVPGSIRSPTSSGTNALVADGCFPVCDVSDILTSLALAGAIAPAPPPSTGPASPARYDGPDRTVWEALSADPASLDQLARVTGLGLPALCGGLERLAAAGVARGVGGWWERL